MNQTARYLKTVPDLDQTVIDSDEHLDSGFAEGFLADAGEIALAVVEN